MSYAVVPAQDAAFAAHCAVYTEDLYALYDWQARLASVPAGRGFWLCAEGNAVAGFALREGVLSGFFLIPPFEDREALYGEALRYAAREVHLRGVPQTDAALLEERFGAVRLSTQRRMLRPTEEMQAAPPEGFRWEPMDIAAAQEMVDVTHEAHTNGFVGMQREVRREEVEEALLGRFRLFRETDSLDVGILARAEADGSLAGLCMAGMYPDAGNGFSTIHQLSVRPEHRRRGLAEAMIRHSIGRAFARKSPVITLGVAVGNPAQALYTRLGFVAKLAFCELLCPATGR